MQQVSQPNDRVDVIAVFSAAKTYPFSFSWGGRKYVIEKVNLVYSKHHGSGFVVSYSVTAQGMYFKLSFYTKEMKWMLEEVVSQ